MCLYIIHGKLRLFAVFGNTKFVVDMAEKKNFSVSSGHQYFSDVIPIKEVYGQNHFTTITILPYPRHIMFTFA